MLARNGTNLGAIQCQLAQAHQRSFPVEPQHLNEHPGQARQVMATEVADPAEVGLLVGGEHPEGGVFPAGLLPPGNHLTVDGGDLLKIQLSGQIQQEDHQVILRQPRHRRRRQEPSLLGVPKAGAPPISFSPACAERKKRC